MENPDYYTSRSDNGEWYTPRWFIDKVVDVLGSIDLDPYSCDVAQRTVQATHFFTKEHDALLHDWPIVETLFANPPYGRKFLDPMVRRLVKEYDAGTWSRGIILVNNATDTRWFRELEGISIAICTVHQRIRFNDAKGSLAVHNFNTRGQIVLYVGDDELRFRDVFANIGHVYQRIT